MIPLDFATLIVHIWALFTFRERDALMNSATLPTPRVPNEEDCEGLAHAALNELHTTTRLEGRRVPLPNVGVRAQLDVAVELNTRCDRYLLYGECKKRVDRRSIVAQVKSYLDGLDTPGLLIAPY